MRAQVFTAGGLDLRPLVDALANVGVADCWVIGNSAGDHIQAEYDPDLVVGVLHPENFIPTDSNTVDDSNVRTPGFSNEDVLLRAGQSSGRKIPTLVIFPPPLKLPTPLQALVFTSCPLTDAESLRLHIWAFVSSAKTVDGPSKNESAATFFLDTNVLLAELHKLDQSPRRQLAGHEFEKLMLDLLQATGAQFATNPERANTDAGFDAAMLPSRDSDSIYLVEMKWGRLDERRLRDSETRLSQAVTARSGNLGVLIYHDTGGRRLPQRDTTSPVVRISAEDLIEKLGSQSLQQIIAQEAIDAGGRI